MYTPNYTISPEVLSAIAEIAETRVIIERSPVLPINELELKRQALIRQVHTSTSIEGNKLAEFQVGKVLSGDEVIGDQKSIIEVKNYQSAVREIERLSESTENEFSLEMIYQLHKILMKGLVEEEKVGKPRPADIYIVDDHGVQGDILRYKGPDAERIEGLLQEMIDWYKSATEDELHPVLKAAFLHLQFVTIHPFTDGNGRMSRLLTQWSLYRDNWDFRKIIVLEEFYNKNRRDYYDAENIVQGHEYQEGRDLTPWLEYFVAGFLVEARKVRKIITSLGFDKANIKTQTFLDSDELKIMDMINSTLRITSDDVMDLLKIAKRTAQLKLKGLVEKELIQVQGKGPSTFYVLPNAELDNN
jgi:Fic family protein